MDVEVVPGGCVVVVFVIWEGEMSFGGSAVVVFLGDLDAGGQYFKEFLGIDWLDPANYDICLSTDVLSIEKAVGLIKESISLPE